MKTSDLYKKIKKESQLPVGRYYYYGKDDEIVYAYSYSICFKDKTADNIKKLTKIKKEAGFECFANDGSEKAESYNERFTIAWSHYAYNFSMNNTEIFKD